MDEPAPRPEGFTDMTRTTFVSTLASVLVWLTSIGMAAAQAPPDGRGARVSGVFGGANARSATDFSFAGSFGYRFDRLLGVEFEVTTIPGLEPEPIFTILSAAGAVGSGLSIPSIPPGLVIPSILPIETSGRGIFFTANFRCEIPTGRRWLVPYVAGGGGVASVTNRVRFGPFTRDLRGLVPEIPSGLIPGGLNVTGGLVNYLQTAIFPPINRDFSNTTTHLTLDLGGGVSFVVLKGLSLDADLRYYRVFADPEFNVVRFGTGASYRF